MPQPNGTAQRGSTGNDSNRSSANSLSGSDANPTNNEPRATRRAGGTVYEAAKPPAVPVKKTRPYVAVARCIVEDKFFTLLTTLLTLYALTSDDLRIIFTNKPADFVFNYMVLAVMVVFTIEILVSCIAKDDYYLGFFFYLDVLSTMSLVLDITWVADLMAGGGSDGEENASNMRSGRTARLGAKAGRVVRVLRLVRILKLYKAVYDARVEAKRKQAEALAAKDKKPGDDDEWDDADLEEKHEVELAAESRVGKKLSEMTTRRTIILILTMLLVLPLLRGEVSDQVAYSAHYGADNVYATFGNFQQNLNSAKYRNEYELSLLHYAYYHNWYAKANQDEYCPQGFDLCSDLYYSHLFWFGVMGKNRPVVHEKARTANLTIDTIRKFDQDSKNHRTGIYNLGIMPDKAQELLSGDWVVDCDTPTRARRGVSLLAAEVDGANSYTVNCPDDLRLQEKQKFFTRLITGEQHDEWHLAFYFDMRPFVRQESVFSLLVVLFVLVLLICGSIMFSHDANSLVVHPVENMIKKVQAIRENPLIAMQMADDEFKAEEIAKARKKRQNKDKVLMFAQDLIACKVFNTGASEPMETVILEKTIIKLGSLLALGFGEAGANIISHNMRGDDTAGVNAMVPGTHVESILGVIRVRDFSTATEVLQSRIMTFVNQIAEIVHGVIDEYHGAPNKNNGDTFLVIWRMDAEDMETRLDKEQICRLAEMSVVACARTLGAINCSPVLAEYRTHPGLQYRLGSRCRVNLSFGLHAGWAIEGAVGSEFKIDASYLSPHVSIATNIEHATQIYGVSLIVAQSVVELCNAAVVTKCRLIDRLMIRGSKTPMQLYVVDLDYRAVIVDTSKPVQIVWNNRNRFKARQFLQSEKTSKWNTSFNLATVFETDKCVAAMRQRYTVEFFQLFNMGYENYSQGEWQVARRMLSCTRAILGMDDGPSSALLRFMEVPYQYEAPKDWTGVRELGSREMDRISS